MEGYQGLQDTKASFGHAGPGARNARAACILRHRALGPKLASRIQALGQNIDSIRYDTHERLYAILSGFIYIKKAEFSAHRA